MRLYFFCLMLFFSIESTFSQVKKPPISGEDCFGAWETDAKPKEGMNQFMGFIYSQVGLDEEVETKLIEKRKEIKVSFVVEDNGVLTRFKVLTTTDEMIQKVILEAFKSYPKKWQPAIWECKPASQKRQVTLRFRRY